MKTHHSKDAKHQRHKDNIENIQRKKDRLSIKGQLNQQQTFKQPQKRPDCSEIGEGNGTPFQYSCLENPMDGGAWQAAVHGVAKSWTRLSDFTFTFHFRALEKAMATHSSTLAWRIPGMGSLVGCRLWGHTESDTTEATQQQQQQQQINIDCIILMFKRFLYFLLFLFSC